ncbi:ATP-dependent sacrificial sulfur transferase LarE [Fusibacter sp. 3D3]|uniref:ATP-dependent sacrificial sulfur transferase LarE n=1 Tax=Fusibacter sp. 3D3 TaxID=1048380 RepID=UPI000853310D
MNINQAIEKLRKVEPKFEILCKTLEETPSIVVAFSGGVDSTFLVAVASVVARRVMALTVRSPYIATWEIEEAVDLTKVLNLEHHILEATIPETIKYNPSDRCYLCKREIFSKIKKIAEKAHYNTVCDGSNYDDLGDYRPGMRALKELEIKSPLLECQVTKAEIRSWSKTLGLETWDKPPYACLLTRMPYDTLVEPEALKMIEKAEAFIIDMGIRAIRVRKHNDLARIEVDAKEMSKMLNLKVISKVVEALKSYGFNYVTLDLAGYKMGSFNDTLEKE